MERDDNSPVSPSLGLPVDAGSIVGKNLSILAVDDEPVARILMKKILAKCGYSSVDITDNGQKALDMLKKKHYDLILSDLHMPGMDGIGLVKSVRQIPSYAKVPFIIMSAAEDIDSNFNCLDAGADHYILKPIKESSLKNLYIYKWRKETEMKKETEMSNMRAENEQLKSQMSEAVETPINVITKTIAEINQKKDSLTPDVQRALGVIVKSLGSSNLYRPAFSKILEQSDTTLDGTTKRWLSQELRYDEVVEARPASTSSGFISAQAKNSGQHSEVLRSWEFNCLQHSIEDLIPLLEQMFSDFGLFEVFGISRDKFKAFLFTIRDNYNSKNPYHNFKHAFDVTQASYCFLTRSEAAQYLNNLEVLSLLLSALGHDLKHPGLNNTYLVNTSDAVALTYNDRSVLENYHVYTLFDILRRPGCDILSSMTPVEYKDFRKLSVSLILSTDISVHGEHISKFNAVIPTFSSDNATHREQLLSILIKASDISNPARPALIARFWTNLVQEEFWMQGDTERSKGLKVSPFMDRQNPEMPKMSIGFIDFFVKGLFKSVVDILPKSEECLQRVNETRERWVKIKADEDQAATEAKAAAEAKANANSAPPPPVVAAVSNTAPSPLPAGPEKK